MLVREKAVRVVATIFDILEAAAIDRVSLAVFPRTAEGAHQHFVGVHVAAASGAHGALPARELPSLVRSSSTLGCTFGDEKRLEAKPEQRRNRLDAWCSDGSAFTSASRLAKRGYLQLLATPRPLAQGPAPPSQLCPPAATSVYIS